MRSVPSAVTTSSLNEDCGPDDRIVFASRLKYALLMNLPAGEIMRHPWEPDIGGGAWQQDARFPRGRLLLLIGSIACLVGCGKPSATSPTPAETASQVEESPSAPRRGDDRTPPAAAGASESELATALSELTQAVRRYAMEQRRAPKSLDELVQQGYLERVPQAPPGKAFAIDKKLQVYLANH